MKRATIAWAVLLLHCGGATTPAATTPSEPAEPAEPQTVEAEEQREGDGEYSVPEILRLATELSEFRALLEEAQLSLPGPKDDGIVLAIPNQALKALPPERLETLKANRTELRRVMACHLDAVACFKPTSMKVEVTAHGTGVRFGNLVAMKPAEGPQPPHGAVTIVLDLADPPADFQPR